MTEATEGSEGTTNETELFDASALSEAKVKARPEGEPKASEKTEGGPERAKRGRAKNLPSSKLFPTTPPFSYSSSPLDHYFQ